jgi:hypothetical protein
MTTTTLTTTSTEWGVRLTWPDGHSETSARPSRARAESEVRSVNGYDRDPAAAELVSRQVTVTEWEVRPS